MSIETLQHMWTQTAQAARYVAQQTATYGGYLAKGGATAGGYIAQGASVAGGWTVHVLGHVAQFTGTQLCRAGGAFLDLASRTAAAAAPHLDRFKNFTLKTMEENKIELIIAGACLAIGGIIGATIASMWGNNKPQGGGGGRGEAIYLPQTDHRRTIREQTV
jgi:hypothetical protein